MLTLPATDVDARWGSARRIPRTDSQSAADQPLDNGPESSLRQRQLPEISETPGYHTGNDVKMNSSNSVGVKRSDCGLSQ